MLYCKEYYGINHDWFRDYPDEILSLLE
jgi:hypothetical protein